MMNYNDRIILDDDVEIEYQERNNSSNNENVNTYTSYSNNNVNTNNFFSRIFSKKYLALTLATMSVFMTVFMEFLIICGVKSHAFLGIWFFISAGLCLAALTMNIINFAKNKKVDLNVSSIISFISLFLLFLI